MRVPILVSLWYVPGCVQHYHIAVIKHSKYHCLPPVAQSRYSAIFLL